MYYISRPAHKLLTEDNLFADVETEDDEVVASVLKVKPVVVPEGLVPALTDKTFDVIKNENDLLVVNFFQPCKLLQTISRKCSFL